MKTFAAGFRVRLLSVTTATGEGLADSLIGQRDKALLTPNDAIGTSQEGSYLLVVGADNVVHRKIVKTGARDGELRVIESGLDPSDWVVTDGIQRAFPGAKGTQTSCTAMPPAWVCSNKHQLARPAPTARTASRNPGF